MLPTLIPPTDNLYKFLAVFGLVVTLAGFTLTYLAADRATEAALAANDQLRQLHAAVAGNAPAQQAVAEAMLKLQEGKADVALPSQLKTAGADPAAVAQAVAMQRAGDVFTYRKALALGGGMTFVACAAGLGLVLSILGFVGWFFRIQRHEDALLRRKAETDQPASPASKLPLRRAGTLNVSRLGHLRLLGSGRE